MQDDRSQNCLSSRLEQREQLCAYLYVYTGIVGKYVAHKARQRRSRKISLATIFWHRYFYKTFSSVLTFSERPSISTELCLVESQIDFSV